MFRRNIALLLNVASVIRTAVRRSCNRRYAACLMMTLFFIVPLATGSESQEMNGQQSGEAAHAGHDSRIQCLPSGDGYLRAHLSGSVEAELDWRNNAMSCAGSVRPDGNGLRLRFSHASQHDAHPLILLFGISGVREGEPGNVLAVNVTIIREGRGEFYSTQGDKCTIDHLQQTVLPGRPTRNRSYRVEAHGFCNQPARAVSGDGAVLVTRFDFAGRVDSASEDDSTTFSNATP